jgi:site-specific DNA-methyltransferase (adenine-specific)
LPDASVDAVVTDPPYELGFMGKAWDASGVAYDVPMWAEVLRVLKPGGHLLAFGGTRTSHRMVCAIEDAGFEIRDSIHWLYGSGFPKSLNVSKAIDKAAGAEREVVGPTRAGAQQSATNAFGVWGDGITPTAPATPEAEQWEGWGTALKPAHEPIVVARKPLVGTVAANVLAYGTGALNIDGCRIVAPDGVPQFEQKGESSVNTYGNGLHGSRSLNIRDYETGRWPANVVLTHHHECRQITTTDDTSETDAQALPGFVTDEPTDDPTVSTVWECHPECPASIMDTQSGQSSSSSSFGRNGKDTGGTTWNLRRTNDTQRGHDDAGGASRYLSQTEWHTDDVTSFLYQPKPNKAERNAGLDGLPKQVTNTNTPPGTPGSNSPRAGAKRNGATQNFHPTVKPIALMEYLVRLVTPPGGTVLDPFTGSGTTGIAALREGFHFIGIEQSEDYVERITRPRLDAAAAGDELGGLFA